MSAWREVLGRRGRQAAHWVVVGAALGYLAWKVPGFVEDVTRSGRTSLDVRWEWVAVAAVSSLAALALYGEMHRQLLLVGSAHLAVRTVQGINIVENAVSSTIPVVGGAGALAYAIDQLRRRGVDTALASWSVLVAGLVDTLTLAALGALGLGWAGRVSPVVAVLITLGVVLVAVGGWAVLTHPAVLRRGLHGLLTLASRIPGFCPPCRDAWRIRTEQAAGRLSTRIALLRPGAPRWLLVTLLAVVSWTLDYLALTATVASVGMPVPWALLAVGFLIVQGSIALQIFPGGAGLAETGLLGVLLAGGLAAAPAAVSVLIYRAISWLGLSLLGWAVYAAWIHTSPIHIHRHAPELSQV
ncbi:MAG TPA: lysylphosphatidylglycerol synthase domain-containing protein [Amycolatopsis sp.]|uniref:lysylphosphatidylglycerol synthase domain-containing protein n=1 Tax=Amycolatopsis sp. TaxID=37632 RepID=UPI002B49A788|nr:lysylphosphatidylglycerol synthase domain-containing protein [Amycolatopsis sp.]HKS47751.1 lysylphosphatidylglycerol synthase domain-containing protein [Amycolatopsis sp.]